MGKPTLAQRREDREKAARVTQELAALGAMTTADLAARFEELTGQPPRSKNRAFLRKRVAWHLQAAEYGGLSDEALAKIDELAPAALKAFEESGARRGSAKPRPAPAVSQPPPTPGRDPRLPAPGTALERSYRGDLHEVTVLDDGFEYRGAHYRSLSRIAREITGTAWNGFTFFGCGARSGSRGRAPR